METLRLTQLNLVPGYCPVEILTRLVILDANSGTILLTRFDWATKINHNNNSSASLITYSLAKLLACRGKPGGSVNFNLSIW